MLPIVYEEGLSVMIDIDDYFYVSMIPLFSKKYSLMDGFLEKHKLFLEWCGGNKI